MPWTLYRYEDFYFSHFILRVPACIPLHPFHFLQPCKCHLPFCTSRLEPTETDSVPGHASQTLTHLCNLLALKCSEFVPASSPTRGAEHPYILLKPEVFSKSFLTQLREPSFRVLPSSPWKYQQISLVTSTPKPKFSELGDAHQLKTIANWIP